MRRKITCWLTAFTRVITSLVQGVSLRLYAHMPFFRLSVVNEFVEFQEIGTEIFCLNVQSVYIRWNLLLVKVRMGKKYNAKGCIVINAGTLLPSAKLRRYF